ncbi:uncharacterized protein K02A2.6-like [Hydractinia symbiolongicarpus]|uniref:uncharacterized protein K02A2.6-like n=1 Tax=Hydractinia symbiolongicarpus TaxID=13093 RepID=UPI00254A44D4|nr:uncharacterized protein K02A2.6-like [Hydractinia symbiolongicarpus]
MTPLSSHHTDKLIQMNEIPSKPLETVAADLKGPFPDGEHLLVLLDYRSRYPIVNLMKHGTSSSQIIKKLGKKFSLFGYPQTMLTDIGPQFASTEFKEFLKHHNIKHRPVTPSEANGEVKRFNRTLGKVIRCSIADGRD